MSSALGQFQWESSHNAAHYNTLLGFCQVKSYMV